MYDQDAQQWVDWMDTAPQFQCNPDTPFAEIMVPTADTIRYTFVMRMLLLAGHNVLAVGETGTGKTLAVQVQNLLIQPLFFTSVSQTPGCSQLDAICEMFL